jgi:hypothetical protein
MNVENKPTTIQHSKKRQTNHKRAAAQRSDRLRQIGDRRIGRRKHQCGRRLTRRRHLQRRLRETKAQRNTNRTRVKLSQQQRAQNERTNERSRKTSIDRHTDERTSESTQRTRSPVSRRLVASHTTTPSWNTSDMDQRTAIRERHAPARYCDCKLQTQTQKSIILSVV